VDRFNGVLATSLAGLGALLALAALAQVSVGLSPLRALQQALLAVREGRTPRLEGRFPAELQALIDDFNGVLDRNAEGVARARTQAGNLAHALKTPLAVLGNAAAQAPHNDLAPLVAEQVQVAQRHIHWHLARARVAASQGLPGQRTPLAPLVDGLLRVMAKLHADRGLDLAATGLPADAAFAGEAQDLQEMLGNLLDNACRSARHAVRVGARREGAQLHITVDDDGPGIAPDQRDAVLRRGVRLDESTPGSGLGLAIVVELASLYGGALTLATSDRGGLCARLSLPAAA
jgi:signal transduction histidine kinase